MSDWGAARTRNYRGSQRPIVVGPPTVPANELGISFGTNVAGSPLTTWYDATDHSKKYRYDDDHQMGWIYGVNLLVSQLQAANATGAVGVTCRVSLIDAAGNPLLVIDMAGLFSTATHISSFPPFGPVTEGVSTFAITSVTHTGSIWGGFNGIKSEVLTGPNGGFGGTLTLFNDVARLVGTR